ncbi:MAG: Ger(x)C family spore germination protein [Deltaproteobacteria bacterium]
MVKRLLTVGLLMGMLLVSGCWDLREINASVIASGIGIDLAEADKINFTAQLLHITAPSESGSSQSHPTSVSAVDYSVAMAARRTMLSLSMVPEWTHVKTFLLGERLARQDLSLCLDFMTRNRNIRPDTNLMVCVGDTPEDVLRSQIPLNNNLGSGLNDMLRENEVQLGFYVPVTIEEFTYRLSSPGLEPAIPQIKLVENSGSSGSSSKKGLKPTLSGMAVFKGKKMIGSLDEYESRGYRWLASASKKGGFMTIKSPANPRETIGLEIIDFNSKVKPQVNGDNITISIKVKADLGFYEQDGTGELLKPSMTRKLEQAADQEINRQITACINRSQSLGSDIMGWGQEIRINNPEEWKRLYPRWGDIYPSVSSDIQVRTQIDRSYLDSKSFKFQ